MGASQLFKASVEWAGLAIEATGVIVIVAGALLAAARYVGHYRQLSSDDAYERLRRGLGRSIMVGLEFLVAGDIVRTVVVEQSFESLGLLAIVVAIRTFLSVSLYVEVEGRWPWQTGERYADAGSAPAAPRSPVSQRGP